MRELVERVSRELLVARKGRQRGDEIKYCCAEHEDHNPSASFNVESGVYTCFACGAAGNAKRLAELIGVSADEETNTAAKLQDKSKTRAKNKKNIHNSIPDNWFGKNQNGSWTYRDVDGKELFVVVRYEDSSGKVVIPFEVCSGGYTAGLSSPPYSLYNLDLIHLGVEEPVFIVEGEKCAAVITDLGGLATTSQGGSNRASKTDWTPLAGRTVLIWPDLDEPGEKYAAQVLGILKGLSPAPEVHQIETDSLGLPPKGDVVDYLAEHPDVSLRDLLALPQKVIDLAKVKVETEPAQKISEYELDDIGNAQRLCDLHGDRFVYCEGRGWMGWTGKRWTFDVGEVEIIKAAKDTVRSMYEEARAASKPDRETLLRNAARSGKKPGVMAMIELARPSLSRRMEEFDQDPWLLNVHNGILDLRTGTLRKHSPDDLLTKIVPFEYSPETTAPLWEAFLDRIFGQDRELIDYMQEVAGYALTGLTSEQCVFLAFGNGANGKSVFTETMKRVFGDYAATAEMKSFQATERSGGSIRNDLASLAGSRLVLASEPEAGARFSESLIKQLTGGESIKVRFLFKEYFELKPTFTIFCSTNYLPKIKGKDEGIWRRLRVIPFEIFIPEAERDLHLVEKLEHEGSGILRWCVEGCRRWHERGHLVAPETVRNASLAYRSTQDVITDFLVKKCAAHPLAVVSKEELYHAYYEFCEAAGVPAETKAALGKILTGRGYDSRRGTKGVRLWVGLEVVTRVTGVTEDLDPPPGGDDDGERHCDNSSLDNPSLSSLWSLDHPEPNSCAEGRSRQQT